MYIERKNNQPDIFHRQDGTHLIFLTLKPALCDVAMGIGNFPSPPDCVAWNLPFPPSS